MIWWFTGVQHSLILAYTNVLLFLFLATFLSSYVNEKKKIEYLQKLERWCDVNLSYKNLIETRCVLFGCI
jgi:hypothetical protein